MAEGRVLTLEEVTSTQDAAVEHNLQAGDVCVSFNQTAGRGRRGQLWHSSGGVAVTVVHDQVTPYLPIAVAATLAAQLSNVVPTCTIGVKWPNDLLVEGKKLAGILIEMRGSRFLVGVGVNVLEAPIGSATALFLHGFEGTRASVAALITTSVFDAMKLDENSAVEAWRKRDILIGTYQTLQTGDNIIEGMVIDIDPCHNLILQTDCGILELPAATSTFITPRH